MKCFGKYNKEDRICQLCMISNKEQANKCEEETCNRIIENKKHNDKIRFIIKNCPHRDENMWDEYERFTGCTIDGGSGRHTPCCFPKIECEKYCGL